jgi:hypothetical protein
MNAQEVAILIRLIDSAGGWISMEDLTLRYRRRTRCDDSRSILKQVESAVDLLGKQGLVETGRQNGVRLMARKKGV